MPRISEMLVETTQINFEEESCMKRKYLGADKRYILKSEKDWAAETHEYLPELCDQLNTAKISRRDFLRQACLLGMAAPVAYGLAGSLTGRSSLGYLDVMLDCAVRRSL